MNITFKRACPGLYVDSTNQLVISNEGRNYYSIRRLVRWGVLLDGKTLFPEYGSVWLGDYRTLAEAKQAVIRMLEEQPVWGEDCMTPSEVWMSQHTQH